MEEKRGTLEATAESTAVSVGRSGKIRQKRAVSEAKSEERCHWKKLAAVYFVLDCTPGSSGVPNLPRVTKTWPQKHSARAENEQWEDRCVRPFATKKIPFGEWKILLADSLATESCRLADRLATKLFQSGQRRCGPNVIAQGFWQTSFVGPRCNGSWPFGSFDRVCE